MCSTQIGTRCFAGRRVCRMHVTAASHAQCWNRFATDDTETRQLTWMWCNNSYTEIHWCSRDLHVHPNASMLDMWVLVKEYRHSPDIQWHVLICGYRLGSCQQISPGTWECFRQDRMEIHVCGIGNLRKRCSSRSVHTGEGVTRHRHPRRC